MLLHDRIAKPRRACRRAAVLFLTLWLLRPAPAVADGAPSDAFDLTEWKLQIPGPKEVDDLKGYSSDYFRLTDKKELSLRVDAAEKGSTPNSPYVRSELRHLAEWDASEARTLSAEVRVVATGLKPDKLTVLQIHGIAKDGGHAPPLVRVAVQKGNLVAIVKTTNDGKKDEVVTLRKGLNGAAANVDVSVEAKRLIITVDGQEKLSRSIAFWKHRNYFKAGCYPQATSGKAEVIFTRLTATGG